MRRALAILLNFTRSTGHRHPNLETIANNYCALLIDMGKTREEAIAILRDVAPELF